jgi:hypothetical protein
MKTVKCKICPTMFKRKYGRRYCSPDCSAEAKRRNDAKRYDKHLLAVNKAPVQERFIPHADDWCQADYEREQRELQKPNGRTCTWSGCNEKLRGANRRLCPTHDEKNKRRGDAIWWELEAGNVGAMASHGIM